MTRPFFVRVKMIKDKLSRSCDVLRLFRENGFEAYIVGGTVRDLILGSHFTDVDIATSAQSKDIMDVFPGAKMVGNEPFCTLVIPQEGWTIEVTPFQGDTLFDDLSRRDFTINAMAINFVGELVDPFGGLQDITKRIIRFTGSPGDRIKEDPIRCIRLFRFASTLKGFSIDGPSMEEAKESLPLFENIPPERVGKEVYKVLRGSPFRFLELLHDTGFLAPVLPQIYALKNVSQDPYLHPEGDVYEHTRLCIKNAEILTNRIDVRAAALFHDIAKPNTIKEEEGRIRFIGHEKDGGKLAKEIMTRWAWPSYFVRSVAAMVRWHMVPLISSAPRRIPKLYMQYGRSWLDGLFLLSYIDITSSNGDYTNWMENREIALSCVFKFSGKRKLISGRDVMDILNIEQGPEVGRILSSIYELMARGKIKSRDDALNYLKHMIKYK